MRISPCSWNDKRLFHNPSFREGGTLRGDSRTFRSCQRSLRRHPCSESETRRTGWTQGVSDGIRLQLWGRIVSDTKEFDDPDQRCSHDSPSKWTQKSYVSAKRFSVLLASLGPFKHRAHRCPERRRLSIVTFVQCCCLCVIVRRFSIRVPAQNAHKLCSESFWCSVESLRGLFFVCLRRFNRPIVLLRPN